MVRHPLNVHDHTVALYWIVITSLKAPGAIYELPLKYWPSEISFDNYIGLFTKSDFGRYMVNSLIVATVASTIATLIALLSAYVLARFQFAGRGAVMAAFLLTQMIPGFIALGPLYMMMSNFDLVDSKTGLILVYIAICIPFCTSMLRDFFENVPNALEEAAMIDGCSRLSALFRVLVPVVMPGSAANFIFSFSIDWGSPCPRPP